MRNSLLAWVPWLWYRIMDPRLLALPHIDGDLAKINIDPDRRAEIDERYHSDDGEPR